MRVRNNDMFNTCCGTVISPTGISMATSECSTTVVYATVIALRTSQWHSSGQEQCNATAETETHDNHMLLAHIRHDFLALVVFSTDGS